MNDRLDTASDWLLRMQSDPLTEAEVAEWLKWYDADPANRAAFERLQGTFEGLRGASAEAREEMARKLGPRAIDAPAGLRATIRPIRSWLSHHRAWVAAAATSLAFAVGIGVWQYQPAEPVQTAAFKTERARHQLVELPDGSRVRLGARSQLFTNFTPQTRYLVLEGGEAFFDVAKDPTRPFLVQAGTVTVRAVGTEFNVRRIMDQTVVTVTEGEVVVIRGGSATNQAPKTSDLRLRRDEQATIAPSNAEPVVRHVAAASATAWQEGRLEFVDEPLSLVIGTVNRYSTREVVIVDRTVNDLHFTGTVNGDRIDEWLAALPDIFPVSVQRAGVETVFISKRPSR